MATTSSFAHLNERLQMMAFCPEVTQGTPNWDVKADDSQTGGPVHSPTTTYVNTGSGSGAHDLNLAGASDDIFNGLYIYVKTGSRAGEVKKITDFTEGANYATFTHEAFSGALADTDQFYVFAPLPASSVAITSKTENLERDFARLTYDPPSSLKGLTMASGSFDLELFGLETPSADGSAAGLDRLSQLLQFIGTRGAKVGEAVTGSGSTTTQIDVTDASPYAAGDIVLINNQIRRVTATNTGATPDNITVSPALSAAPTAGTIVYLAETFTPAETGHRSHTFLFLTDDRLVEVRGCMCSLKITAEYGAALKASVEFDASAWDWQDAFALDGQQSTKYPPVYKTAAAQHFGTTLLNTRSWEFDLAHGRAETRDTAANVRYDIRTRKATCSVSFRDTAVTPKETWESSATQGFLLVACGNASGSAVAVGGNAQIQDGAESQNQNDTRYYQASFGFVDDQTDYATPSKPVLCRF